MKAVSRDRYYSSQTHRAAVSRTSRRVRLLCSAHDRVRKRQALSRTML